LISFEIRDSSFDVWRAPIQPAFVLRFGAGLFAPSPRCTQPTALSIGGFSLLSLTLMLRKEMNFSFLFYFSKIWAKHGFPAELAQDLLS
jgi:hypothetical protein